MKMSHEFGIVQSQVGELLKQLKREGIKHVAEIHFQRGSAFSEEALQQAFDVLIQGTPMQDAKVVIETINLNHECPFGHMFLCPVCGTIREIEEAHDLEITKVIAAPVAHVSV
jgi:hydrogenase nickel incorporation protein HypA/HybF